MNGPSIYEQVFRPQLPTCTWVCANGRFHSLNVHGLSDTFLDVPAIYIFAKYSGVRNWTALYVGQTDCLQRRISEHRRESPGKLLSAINLGATGIHAMVAPSAETDRVRLELDLIRSLRPPLNEVGLRF